MSQRTKKWSKETSLWEEKRHWDWNIRRDKTSITSIWQGWNYASQNHYLLYFQVRVDQKRICIISGRWIWINSHHPLMVIKVRDDKNRETPQVLTSSTLPPALLYTYLLCYPTTASHTCPLVALLQQGYIWHQEGYWETSLTLQLTFQALTG